MATGILRDQRFFMDGYELTSVMNSVALDYSAELRDDTVFGDTTRSNIGGLKGVTLGVNGYVDDSFHGSLLFDKVGLQNVVASIAAADAAEGDVGYLMRLAQAQFNPGGAIGDLYAFQISGSGSGALVRGTLLMKGSKTSTADGTAQQLGAVSSTQKLHASLHVIAASGTSPTLDVVIESDSADDFSGSETSRITFTQKSDIGAEYLTADGAITDDWFRVAFTIGGSDTPTFDFVVFVGII